MDIGSFKQRMQSSVNELINPLSYYEWVNKHTTLQGLPYTCDRYPFQKQIMNDMSRELACVKPSQVGLPISLKTKVFSEKGWKNLDEIAINDYVYTPKGKLTKVVYLSPIQTDSPCYEITFCDGTKIVADENHRWYVHSDKAFNLNGLYPGWGRIPLDSDYARKGRITTKAIFENYKGTNARRNTNIFYIPCAEPMQTSGFKLPVDPYYLGLWLGNGSRHTGVLTINQDYLPETIAAFESKGMTARVYVDPKRSEGNCRALTIYEADGKTTYSKLKDIFDPTQPKTFNPNWLLLSIEDRFELLQGMIDSDGNISKLGRIEFYNTSKSLADGFSMLAASLGFKPRMRVRKVEGLNKQAQLKNGNTINSKKDIYACHFMAYNDVTLSKLQFKQSNLKPREGNRSTESFQRRIVDVQPVSPVPVRCIMVEDEEHQFVCSEAFITTSNTELQLRKALAFVARNPYRNLIYTMPNEDMRKRVAQNRLIPILSNDKIFHTRNAEGKKSIRSIEITEVGTSQMLMFPANENAATSQPADVVFNDEIDLSDPQIIALFNSRLQGSDLKINQNFSTPTFEGLGISAMYDISDQHEYMFKCPHCGFYQLPDYTSQYHRIPGLPVDVAVDSLLDFDPMWVEKYRLDLSEAYSVCVKCEKPVTYGDDVNHSWVPKNPHRTVRGYKVSPFSTRSLDITYILETFLKYMALDNMKGFKNTVLGVTHESGDERLSESLLRSLFQQQHAYPNFENPSKEHPYFIGVDMGATCHITVSRAASPRKVEYVLFETVKLEKLLDRLKYLKEVFGITGGGGIDRLPMINDSNKVRDWSHFRIMPMQYGSRKGVMVHPVEDEYGALSYLEVSRTMHLDKLAESLRNGYATFSGFNNQKDTIIKHLRAMVRILEEDKNGMEKVPVWKKKDKNDHYFHALGYNYQAILQYYEGYSYDAGQSQNSTILLFGLEENPFYQRGSHTLLGGR